jgi:hypothetical protein
MYTIWIKIDETLPWIELKGDYDSRRKARKAAKQMLEGIDMKIVKTSEKKRKTEALTAKH